MAEEDEEIARCFSVLAELRPHLQASEFVERVRRQQSNGFQMAFLEDDEEVKSVAGFRCGENLAMGRFLYVDDLVTLESARSKGYGDALFDWLLEVAKQQHCAQFHLDSGVQRFDAHRFYLRKKMKISSHHFALELE